jgi:hypothetical protein
MSQTNMRFRGLNHLGTNVLDVLYFVNSDHFSYKQVIIYECNYFSSAGRRVYHRNAAYEDELWREEKRKAVRHRQRVRRFNKRLSLKGKVSNTEVTKTIPEVTTENLPVSVTDTTESKEEDNSGTWEVKNTSTMLRNGKSKGALSMKLLFRPQERRRFRRRMRKRGKIRYGLRKAVPRRSKLVPYNPVVQHGLSQSMTPLSKELNGQGIDVSHYKHSRDNKYFTENTYFHKTMSCIYF